MRKINYAGLMGLASLLAIFISCSSTQLISSWKAPESSDRKFDKVLVIGLMGNKDRSLRENVENIITEQLRAKGINAGSAFAEYGPKTFEGLKEEEAIKQLRSKGYDGAVTVVLLDKTKARQYNPGMMGMYARPYRFWGYYNMMYTRIYEPGYYTVTNRFMLEANVYDLSADKLIYSAQTKSVDPASPQSLATEFSNRIFEDMNKQGILK